MKSASFCILILSGRKVFNIYNDTSILTHLFIVLYVFRQKGGIIADETTNEYFLAFGPSI